MDAIAWIYANCKFAKNPISPEFWKWFGNSKVVDDSGQPLRVYKGMYPYDYNKEEGTLGFQPRNEKNQPAENIIKRIQRPSKFPSFYKDDPGIDIAGFFGGVEVAGKFSTLFMGGATYAAYLSLQNPYIIDAKGQKAGFIQFGETGIPFREAMRSGQYDGAIIKNTEDEGTIYVAQHPDQIRSAIADDPYPTPKTETHIPEPVEWDQGWKDAKDAKDAKIAHSDRF